MSQGSSETVECPLCEEEFDPSAAGGWCTNSDCGEWQYETSEGADEGSADDAADGGGADGSAGEPADPDGDGAGEDPGSAAEDGHAESDDEAADDADAGAADESDAADGQAAGADDGQASGDGNDADGETDAGDEELSCPNCDESVAPEDNYCATCGEDVSALEPGPLEACPECDESVEPDDNFCVNCGENLAAYRPDASSDDREPERASVASPATNNPESETEERPVEESLKLVVRNHEIRVWDGDTVGRKVRGIVIETGGDEEDAVRIHREHIRFIREGEQFYVKALGQNPTVVNGDRIQQGERRPIDPEDRIELSGIAKIRVEEP